MRAHSLGFAQLFALLTVATLVIGFVLAVQDKPAVVPQAAPVASSPAPVRAAPAGYKPPPISVVPAAVTWEAVTARAVAFNKVSMCQELTALNDRYFCLLLFAGAKKDQAVCNSIPETVPTGLEQEVFWTRAACLSQVTECKKASAHCEADARGLQ